MLIQRGGKKRTASLRRIGGKSVSSIINCPSRYSRSVPESPCVCVCVCVCVCACVI
jgi:hypothetical protein